MSVRYQPDYAGIGELMNGPEMQAVMAEIARKGTAFATGIAPVGKPPGDRHPGMFRSGFSTVVHGHGGPHGDRAEGLVLSDAEDHVLVEVVDHYRVLAETLGELAL